jgi:GH15 family glucan-1,4-alpha-glucosidase
MLDKDKGGHFTISPPEGLKITTKQQYLPSNNILQTRYLHDDGVLTLTDFFPRPLDTEKLDPALGRGALKRWLVRRVECIRGATDVNVDVFPAFNYAQDSHTTDIIQSKETSKDGAQQVVHFRSKTQSLELVATIECGDDAACPRLEFSKKQIGNCSLGDGVTATINLQEGQSVSFVLRDLEENNKEAVTTALLNQVQKDTSAYWFNWISKSNYKGRWREVVSRSLMILKMLTFEPTGAIVAAPTFSLPEDFGGGRNWDYR